MVTSPRLHTLARKLGMSLLIFYSISSRDPAFTFLHHSKLLVNANNDMNNHVIDHTAYSNTGPQATYTSAAQQHTLLLSIH
jgi:hypothetical protein